MKYFLILLFLMTTQAEAAWFKVYSEKGRTLTISFTGRILQGDHKKFLKFLAPYRRTKNIILYLDSGGGHVRSAYYIGNMVRQAGIITVIGNGRQCSSACSLIFYGGWDKHNNRHYRIKHPWGKLGLHHSYRKVRGRKFKSPKDDAGPIKAYYKRMKAGDVLYRKMMRTSWKSISYVKNRTLSRLEGYYIKSDRPTYPLPKLASNFNGPRYNEEFWRNTNREDVPLPVRRSCGTGCKKTKLIYDRLPPYKGADAIELLRNVAGD